MALTSSSSTSGISAALPEAPRAAAQSNESGMLSSSQSLDGEDPRGNACMVSRANHAETLSRTMSGVILAVRHTTDLRTAHAMGTRIGKVAAESGRNGSMRTEPSFFPHGAGLHWHTSKSIGQYATSQNRLPATAPPRVRTMASVAAKPTNAAISYQSAATV